MPNCEECGWPEPCDCESERSADSLKRVVMRDLPNMTVTEHHVLSIGLLATCYEHVPGELQSAIAEAFESAKQMGLNIKPELVTQTRSLSA